MTSENIELSVVARALLYTLRFGISQKNPPRGRGFNLFTPSKFEYPREVSWGQLRKSKMTGQLFRRPIHREKGRGHTFSLVVMSFVSSLGEEAFYLVAKTGPPECGTVFGGSMIRGFTPEPPILFRLATQQPSDSPTAELPPCLQPRTT